MDYRKECLSLVEELLREDIEQRFIIDTQPNTMFDEVYESMEGLDPEKVRVYREFLTALNSQIAKEVYAESIDAAMSIIIVGMTQISSVFTDDEMHQLYDLAKSPLGLKIIRNMDIMRNAVKDGIMHMAKVLVRKWSSPENAEKVSDFCSKLFDEE